MAQFKTHTISVKTLLETIPTDIFSQIGEIASTTKVDHYAKVLNGQTLFNLLLYGILENERLSLRTLEDTFNSEEFKFLFNVDASKSIRHSSISERLAKVDTSFFREAYQYIYNALTNYYSQDECAKHKIIRVDSSIIYEASMKLHDGFRCNQSSKRAVKTTVAFDGLLPCDVNLFTESTYASENIALPEAVMNYAKRSDKNYICVMDRGLSSAQKMSKMTEEQIDFIVRVKDNRKFIEQEKFKLNDIDAGKLEVNKDLKVRLFAYKMEHLSGGKRRCKTSIVDSDFRLVMCHLKDDKGQRFWFVTNNFEISAVDVANYYARRWDIEVFFRFIKQELNVNHFVSLNKNGIEVMLYMTMICSMLLLIYKKINNLGYKTAKRRFRMEMQRLIISEIVKRCGGDPSLYYK